MEKFQLQPPEISPGDSFKCIQQLNSAYEQAVQFAATIMAKEVRYDEACLVLLRLQDKYKVKLTDNQDFLDWARRCTEAQPGCPRISITTRSYWTTPQGSLFPISIDNVEDMRNAIDSLVMNLQDLGILETQEMERFQYQRWNSCSSQTQIANDNYNTVRTGASINPIWEFVMFTESIAEWMNETYSTSS